jgi:hypothetical protein
MFTILVEKKRGRGEEKERRIRGKGVMTEEGRTYSIIIIINNCITNN